MSKRINVYWNGSYIGDWDSLPTLKDKFVLNGPRPNYISFVKYHAVGPKTDSPREKVEGKGII